MAEPQLIDYIKKARVAGQTDDQTRNLLYKNGWTELEVNEAFFSTAESQSSAPSQLKPTEAIQPKVETQPQMNRPQQQPSIQPQTSTQPKIQAQPQIQTQPQMQKFFPKEDVSHMKVHSHLFSKILIVLIIVVVLAGIVIAASQYLNLSWNPFQSPSPETVISKMMANMKNVKSSHTTTRLDVNIIDKNSKQSKGKLVLNTNSETDLTDINNPKADGNFTVNKIIPGSSSPAALATVSINVVGGSAYVKINDFTFPSSSSATYGWLDVFQLKGKWFKIDQDSISALSQVQGGQSAIPNFLQINNSELYKGIQDLVATENIFSVNKQLNDETVSGQSTYHYSATITSAKLEDLANKLITLSIQKSGNPSPLVVNMAQAAAKTFIDSMGDVNLEMWIGKSDYLLYQVKIDKVIDSQTIAQAFVIDNMSVPTTQTEIKFDMTNSNFNKTITVQAPEGAQKIEEIALPLLRMQKINNDMKQIGFIARSQFVASKNYSSLCYKGLLNGYLSVYGNNLISLNNDIVNQNDNRSPAKKPACFSGVQNYCVSTQLADGSYLCIDKNNILGKTQCTSYATVCK